MKHKFSRQGANIICYILLISIIIGSFANFNYTTAYGYDERAAVVTGVNSTSKLNVRKDAGTRYSVVASLTNGASVTIIGEKYASDGSLWYQTRFTNDANTQMTGYCHSTYIEILYSDDVDFETYLDEQKFPDSYKPALRSLHEKYPNWVFKADIINKTWTEVLNAEADVIGRSLVEKNNISSWKMTGGSSYDWTKSEWTILEGSNWVAASKELVAYFLDPRNFLDETYIFQFESLNYQPLLQTEDGVKTLIKNTFMANGKIENNQTYSSVLMDAANKANVNPYHLASSIIQEIGAAGTSDSISGTVEGYLGIYNYYNWGANTGATPILNALSFAKRTDTATLRPWNTRYAAIVGGAIMLASKYISRGQNTAYYKKFDLVSPYWHQYMTNIQAAKLEGGRIAVAYTAEMKNTSNFVFTIPVYTNMPTETCTCPTKDGSPNNALKSLEVSEAPLTPTFNPSKPIDNLDFTVTVPNTTTSATITSVAYDSKATVVGAGNKTLNVGSNKYTIKVTAENGDVRNYTLTIVRKEATTPSTPSTPTVSTTYTTTLVKDDSAKIIRGLSPQMSISTAVSKFTVTNGTITITDAAGKVKTTGYIGTGDKVIVKDSTDAKIAEFTFVLYGDVNGDGIIDLKDALFIRKHNLGTNKLSGFYLTAGDVDRAGDGVNLKDALVLRKYNLGQRTINQN